MLDVLLAAALGALGALGGSSAALLLRRSRRRAGTKEEQQHEWLFYALAHGRKDIIAKGDPDISWAEAHPHFGTPLHAIGGAGITLRVEGDPQHWTPESHEYIKDLLALFEFAVKRGADPAASCARSCTGCVAFQVRGDQAAPLYDLSEPIAGRSAISLWLALSQRARTLDNSKPEQLPLASAFFDAVLSLLLHAVPKHRGPGRGRQGPGLNAPSMVSVPEAAVELWQSVMLGEDTCDTTLRCVDGDLAAHACVLASSSRVLAAMLRWPHEREPQPSRLILPLQERQEVVEIWRCLVYTGLQPAGALSTELLLEVAELSHRWQDHLLLSGLLASALARRVVDAESCGLVLEVALARDLPELRNECLAFARRSWEVRQDWERQRFIADVQRQLDGVFSVAAFGNGAALAGSSSATCVAAGSAASCGIQGTAAAAREGRVGSNLRRWDF